MLRDDDRPFEDTRDLRLMGGYHSGADPALDRAILLVPRIYDALRQSPDEPLSGDAFQDIARALSADVPEPAGSRARGAGSPAPR